jgi:E3 ubiquitin-protein ligase HUWE1
MSHKSVRELKGPLRIDYTGERGIDAGGLTRDFYVELSRAMFNPNYSLFTPTSNGVSFHPNQ